MTNHAAADINASLSHPTTNKHENKWEHDHKKKVKNCDHTNKCDHTICCYHTKNALQKNIKCQMWLPVVHEMLQLLCWTSLDIKVVFCKGLPLHLQQLSSRTVNAVFFFKKLLTSFVWMWTSQAALASLFISSVHKSLDVGIKWGSCLQWWQCLIGGRQCIVLLDGFWVWRCQHWSSPAQKISCKNCISHCLLMVLYFGSCG